MEPFIRKYPRTPHVRGSRFQHGDNDLEAVPWSELADKNLVIEEKMDGANCAISFSDEGRLLLQSRGHYLRGGPREKHFDILKQWSASQKEKLFGALGTRYVMYGEWLYTKHTFFYDALPHYFMEFDILDTQTDHFLSTSERTALLVYADVNVPSVKVLTTGSFANVRFLDAMIVESYFISKNSRLKYLEEAAVAAGVPVEDAIKHTDLSPLMEGLYIKWEEDGIVKGRYKYVRKTFTSSIMDQEAHWLDRPIIANRLLPGAFERMFDV